MGAAMRRDSKKRTAVTYRLRAQIRGIIFKLAKRENISQTRFVELCIERHAKSVGESPFAEVKS